MQLTHVIWGGVELMNNSSSDPTSSASCELHSEKNDGSASGSHAVRGNARMRNLGKKIPGEIRQYLDGINFADHSTSSDSNKRSSSCSSANASSDRLPRSRSASACTAPMAALKNPEAQGPQLVQLPAEAAALKSDLEDDGNPSLVESAWDDLGEEEREAVIAIMLQSQDELFPGSAELWSVGSALHGERKCRPCHYVHTKLGCLNGNNCEFCHLPHTKKSRTRPCRTKRLQCQKFVSMLEEVKCNNPDKFLDAMQLVSARSSYLQGVLKKRMDTFDLQDPRASSSTRVERRKSIMSL